MASLHVYWLLAWLAAVPLVPGHTPRPSLSIQKDLHRDLCPLQSDAGRVIDCVQNVTIHLNIVNQLQSSGSGSAGYIVVRSVHDIRLKEDVRLLHPLVIKYQQRQVKLQYPATHGMSVNGRPYELVVRSGCHADDEGHVTECLQADAREGFCCECSAAGNNVSYSQRGRQCSEELEGTQGMSAHCFLYDPLWYGVYSLGPPRLQHDLELRLFQDISSSPGVNVPVEGSPDWLDLTEGKVLRLGTGNDTAQAGLVTAGYTRVTTEPQGSPLDVYRQRVLIPERQQGQEEHTAVKGGAAEYLVVPEDMVDTDGTQCDKIGVGPAAFLNQRARCGSQLQSCFGNQPLSLREQDLAALATSGRAQYMLSSFGPVSAEPLVQLQAEDGAASRTYLALDYELEHTSRLSLEISAEHMTPLYKGLRGVITEVLANSDQDMTEVRVDVYNPGLVSSEFRIRLTSCSPPLAGPKVQALEIEANGTGSFRLTLLTPASGEDSDSTVCRVSLLNHRHRELARREVIFRAQDMCNCSSFYQCMCTSSGDATPRRLPRRKVVLAGYRGNYGTLLESTSEAVVLVSLVFGVLLYLGFVKMMLGVKRWPNTWGHTGLGLFWDHPLERYYEKTLLSLPVVANRSGRPINPHTHRPVRMMSYHKEVILNILFFVYLPFWPLHWLLLKCYGAFKQGQLKCSCLCCFKPEVLRRFKPESFKSSKRGYKPVSKKDPDFLNDSDSSENVVFERAPPVPEIAKKERAPDKVKKEGVSMFNMFKSYGDKKAHQQAVQNALKGTSTTPALSMDNQVEPVEPDPDPEGPIYESLPEASYESLHEPAYLTMIPRQTGESESDSYIDMRYNPSFHANQPAMSAPSMADRIYENGAVTSSMEPRLDADRPTTPSSTPPSPVHKLSNNNNNAAISSKNTPPNSPTVSRLSKNSPSSSSLSVHRLSKNSPPSSSPLSRLSRNTPPNSPSVSRLSKNTPPSSSPGRRLSNNTPPSSSAGHRLSKNSPASSPPIPRLSKNASPGNRLPKNTPASSSPARRLFDDIPSAAKVSLVGEYPAVTTTSWLPQVQVTAISSYSTLDQNPPAMASSVRALDQDSPGQTSATPISDRFWQASPVYERDLNSRAATPDLNPRTSTPVSERDLNTQIPASPVLGRAPTPGSSTGFEASHTKPSI